MNFRVEPDKNHNYMPESIITKRSYYDYIISIETKAAEIDYRSCFIGFNRSHINQMIKINDLDTFSLIAPITPKNYSIRFIIKRVHNMIQFYDNEMSVLLGFITIERLTNALES